jgi:hypothetical protein
MQVSLAIPHPVVSRLQSHASVEGRTQLETGARCVFADSLPQ